MWKSYHCLARRYSTRVTRDEARRLILEAQNGSKESKDELILRHMGFLIYKVRTKLFPNVLKRYGEDILGEVILHTYEKINTYDLDYRDKQGNPLPVKFTTYIWKDIDWFIIRLLYKEFRLDKTHKEYYKNEQLYESEDDFGNCKRNKINHRINQRWRPM